MARARRQYLSEWDGQTALDVRGGLASTFNGVISKGRNSIRSGERPATLSDISIYTYRWYKLSLFV